MNALTQTQSYKKTNGVDNIVPTHIRLLTRDSVAFSPSVSDDVWLNILRRRADVLGTKGHGRPYGPFCFTPTEARWLIRDGDTGGTGRESEGSTADTPRKRPEKPWTAARTMAVLRRCPLAIGQRLVHCAIAVLTAVLGSHKDNVLLLRNNPKRKKSNFRSPAPPPCSVQLHLPLDLAGTLCGVCPYLSHTVNTCKQRTSTATTIQVYCSVACAWSAGIIT